ncbi:MAG: hypothetical protein DDT27_01626 [Dehalococcoidia bacterium]|nr:hypothetical protein [Chloroflexota bacterium]MBT9163057.1 hypothetical protein [Chloroflexota bacterium]
MHQLLLKIDSIGGNDHRHIVAVGEKRRWQEISHRFARARACFHNQVLATVKRLSGCSHHLDLFRALLVLGECPGQRPIALKETGKFLNIQQDPFCARSQRFI